MPLREDLSVFYINLLNIQTKESETRLVSTDQVREGLSHLILQIESKDDQGHVRDVQDSEMQN